MSHEKVVKVGSGWLWLVLDVAAYLGAAAVFISGVRGGLPMLTALLVAVVLVTAAILISCGFFIVNPNESRVLQLFGTYRGTVKDSGFQWANPFYTKTLMSLRLYNFETGSHGGGTRPVRGPLGALMQAAGVPTDLTTDGTRTRRPSKVNDKDGNPVEIAAVVSWRVLDTYDAQFAVDNYQDYVHVQSEASLRNLASHYPYDTVDDQVQSLRGDTEAVAEKLKLELQQRLAKVGVEIMEARISHLAYAQEIASAMLQRQQASAIIAARQKIVEGAVGMVEDALNRLAAKDIVHLDDERRAAMVSNLLVVLCSQQSAQPVVNAGTLY